MPDYPDDEPQQPAQKEYRNPMRNFGCFDDEAWADEEAAENARLDEEDRIMDLWLKERAERREKVRNRRKMAERATDPAPSGPPYPVGQGRPPVEYRFRKGQSGNPKGRPRNRGRRRADSTALDFAHQPANRLLLKEAYRLVEVEEGDRTKRLPAIQAVYRSIAESAHGGHRLAQAMWVRLVQQTESAERETRDLSAPGDRLQAWLGAGDPPRVVIDGPANAAEKAALDAVVVEREAARERVAMRAGAYREAETEEARAAALAAWREAVAVFDRLDAGVPGRYRVGVVERWEG